MSLFTVVIEGRLTCSPQPGHTRDGREFVRFSLMHKDRYRDHTGKWVDARPQFFEVMAWGDLAGRARSLTRGDQVLVEGGRMVAYTGDSGMPAITVEARNLSVSMRFTDAHAGLPTKARRADLVTTADGERFVADIYPEVVTDLELVHH
ncbi:single-stranded DNA-binding protein [Catellatospora sp. TT07R-123]|uniref:single-stranded DNA-binding protein n=1 Tax=Catellatospora sp. TT07R-123 TaxID=2733863 RepID=UPI001BB44013|nr:single-stranded DNA-binding protein [Catellatospora sp. TT07R-123]